MKRRSDCVSVGQASRRSGDNGTVAQEICYFFALINYAIPVKNVT